MTHHTTRWQKIGRWLRQLPGKYRRHDLTYELKFFKLISLFPFDLHLEGKSITSRSHATSVENPVTDLC
jgi:hypothetical protein